MLLPRLIPSSRSVCRPAVNQRTLGNWSSETSTRTWPLGDSRPAAHIRIGRPQSDYPICARLSVHVCVCVCVCVCPEARLVTPLVTRRCSVVGQRSCHRSQCRQSFVSVVPVLSRRGAPVPPSAPLRYPLELTRLPSCF